MAFAALHVGTNRAMIIPIQQSVRGGDRHGNTVLETLIQCALPLFLGCSVESSAPDLMEVQDAQLSLIIHHLTLDVSGSDSSA